MKKCRWWQLIPCVATGLYLTASAPAALGELLATCPADVPLAVQVLGSGGPIADDDRASSAYLVWKDGKARALIDVGGGSVLRFAQSGARFTDLDAVLLTHLHADHSADLPSLLKSGAFANRRRGLVLAGPSAGGSERVRFPSLEDYVTALLHPETGAYAYLGGYLDGSDGLPYLRLAMIEGEFEVDEGEPHETEDEDSTEDGEESLEVSRVVLRDSELEITAIAVGHGPVPAVAYRLAVDDKVVVFAGDQDGRGDDLAAFAEAADLLVLHMPIPHNAGARARALHASPRRLGEIAAEAESRAVLLSHFMARSLRDLEGNLQVLRGVYDGPVYLAEDLSCLPLR